MFLIVGLGNPGKKYQQTRHNIGFAAIDKIAADFRPAFDAQISKKEIGGQNVIIAKPQTFMNLSGLSISKIARFYKINPRNIIIIHDDIDLPLGKIRVVKNRGAGGHKGVESTIKELNTKNFTRFRIGIKPDEKPKEKEQLEKFVLKKFTEKEERAVKGAVKRTIEAIEFFLEKGLEKTTNKYN